MLTINLIKIYINLELNRKWCVIFPHFLEIVNLFSYVILKFIIYLST